MSEVLNHFNQALVESNLPSVERIVSSLTETFKALLKEKLEGHKFKKILHDRLSETQLLAYVADSRLSPEAQSRQVAEIRLGVLQELVVFTEVELENSSYKELRVFWSSRINSIKKML